MTKKEPVAGQPRRREAEKTLRMYENIVSVTRDRLAFVDRDYVYHAANTSYAEAFGKRLDEVLEHTVSEVVGAEAFKNVVKGYLDRCFQGESVSYQSWFKISNGARQYLDVRYQPFRDAEGQAVGVVVSSRDITDRKHAEDAMIKEAAALARFEELKHSRQRIVAAQEEVRKQLAEQLHGTVQTRIILILHRLAELRKLLADEKVSGELEELSREIEDLLEVDVRSLSHRLYPSILRQGLIPAIQSLGDQFESRLKITMKLDEGLIARESEKHRVIPETVKLAAYRIVEEALNNVARHSGATEAGVGLEYVPGSHLQLTVADNGRGFVVTDSSSGLGIAIIQGYADMTGGNCVIKSSPGRGTEITFRIPLRGR